MFINCFSARIYSLSLLPLLGLVLNFAKARTIVHFTSLPFTFVLTSAGLLTIVRITLTQNPLRPRIKWQRSQSGRIFITAMIAQLSLSLLPLLGLKKKRLSYKSLENQ